MIKLRLPKPAAANVINRHLYLGSVYTKEQMRAFAEKAVKAEREACAKLVDDIEARCIAKDVDDPPLENIAAAIRARGVA
jgi:hypothetical protein